MSELALRVHGIRFEAEGVHGLELRSPEGAELPAFEAGAHVDLEVGAGRWRSYSLCGSPAERSAWRLAVQRDPASRGGSAHVHEALRVGQLVKVRGPRNQFRLDESAACSVLVAGGIGITPMLSMVHRLSELGHAWELHYFSRARENAAFLADLQAKAAASPGARFLLHLPGQPDRLPVEDIVRSAPPSAHLYCCGPKRMLSAFEEACRDRPADHVHVERFAAADEAALDGGFAVRLARSGQSFAVAPGRSILDTLLDGGVDVPHSCLSGICGSCEVRVLEGVPDHRDEVLSAAERAAGRTMMVCCSGAKSDTLVLDL